MRRSIAVHSAWPRQWPGARPRVRPGGRDAIRFCLAAALPLAFLSAVGASAAAAHPSSASTEAAAGADDTEALDLAAVGPAQSETGWDVSITPYIWLTGLHGNVGVFPQFQPVDVDLSFADLLDDLKFGAMAMVSVRRGRFVAVADLSYVDLGAGAENVGIRDAGFIDVDLDSETFISTLAAGYRAVDRRSLFLDLVAGARLMVSDTRLELFTPFGSNAADSSETWLDPIVGAHFRAPIGNAWSVTAYGDIGGFGIGSDFTWQIFGAVQYAVSRRWTLSAGWRHFGVDYDKGGFVFDVTLGGPLLGATVRF